jgi:vitamin B12 transporter
MIEFRYRRVAALAAALSASVSAQALAQSAQNLGTMVISANRVETAADQVGSSVSVVTAEDLEKKQAVTLQDALQDIPGLDVYSNGNSQMRQRMTMRGQDMQHIVFIVDGVKIVNQASSMYSNPYNHLSASDIERIEVLRGNQSALYGSDAIGGVIIITTKSGKNSQKMVEGEASVEAGSFQTHKANAVVTGRIDDVYYKVAGTRFETDGFDITKKAGRKEADGSSNANLDLKLGADAVKNVGVLDLLNVEGSYNHQDGVANSDNAGNDTYAYLRQTTDTSRFQVKANLFDGLLDNTFAVNRMDSYVYAGTRAAKGNTIPNRYFGDLEKYEYQGILRPVEDHTFVFGAEQERDHYRYQNKTASENRTNSLVNSSVFGNWGMAFLDQALNFNFGTREDFHDTFGEHNTYRGTVSYSIRSTGTRPHASYGTGFNAPYLVMLYGSSGNPDLMPEESRGFDVGVEQLLLDDRLRLDVTVFKTDMTNQQSLEASTKTSSGYQYMNIGSTRSMGVENSASFEVTREWSVSANHTYLEARNNTTGAQIEYMPKHTGSLRVDYVPEAVPGLRTWTRMGASTERFSSGAVSGYSGGRVSTGGYTTWDLGADYAIDDNFTVYGRVLNLLDKDYGQMPGLNNAGISAYGGLRVKF